MKVQTLSGDFLNLKSEVRILKSEIQNFNSEMAAKKTQEKFQSICHNKNNATKFKMADKKLKKRSPNFFVT